MNASFLVVQALNGLTTASVLFITACGLTLVFGVTRIVNFAHGSFYMLGAYLAATLAPPAVARIGPELGFWSTIVVSATIVGLAGLALEFLVLRRIYRVPELFQLLATFAIVLMVGDFVILAFGRDDIFGMRAPGLSGAVTILGRKFPVYDLVLVALGPAILVLLLGLLRFTRFGILVRAATQDREMVGALGVNEAVLFSATLFLGSFLAGLGGALQTPRLPANPQMDISIVTECFVVTVIGGMGSIPGAFIAAVLIGLLQAFGILILPKVTLVLVFLIMAVVLVIRPWGLLGQPETAAPNAVPVVPAFPSFGLGSRALAPALLAALAALPLVADDYVLRIATEAVIASLFVVSMMFLVGTGGLVSFGHAAYFGLGAYGAGLAMKLGGWSMGPALAVAPLAALAGAALFGFFIVRLHGIYLAMLSLAVGQIVYAVAYQWTEVTGGDNGMVGLWTSPWASSRAAFYWLSLGLVAAAILAIRHLMAAPLGVTLAATRDNPQRAAAVGIDVTAHRWLAFVIAGTAAGLAGGLQAFLNGSIDPTLLAVGTSVDALVALLLGGLQGVAGPIVGSVAYQALKAELILVSEYYRLLLGAAILLLILAFPRGIVPSLASALASRCAFRPRLASGNVGERGR